MGVRSTRSRRRSWPRSKAVHGVFRSFDARLLRNFDAQWAKQRCTGSASKRCTVHDERKKMHGTAGWMTAHQPHHRPPKAASPPDPSPAQSPVHGPHIARRSCTVHRMRCRSPCTSYSRFPCIAVSKSLCIGVSTQPCIEVSKRPCMETSKEPPESPHRTASPPVAPAPARRVDLVLPPAECP